MIDIVGKRYWFILISLLIIVPGVIAILAGGLRPSIDFTGGTRWEVRPASAAANNTESFKQALAGAGFVDAQVKGGTLGSGNVLTSTIIMDIPGQITGTRKADIEKALVSADLVKGTTVTETTTLTSTSPITSGNSITGTGKITGTATTTGTTTTAGTSSGTGSTTRILPSEEVSFYSVGPTVGQELVQRAMYAIGLAALAILIYLTIVFRRVPNSFRYGVTAIIALLHDVLVVMGVFAILGLLIGEEIDALFVTAMLTVIGFSVHDTIVVFDRVRENIVRRRFAEFSDVVNYSVVQTLARSINTSITVLMTLFALFMLGGNSVRTFVLALLIGILSGTYSSIFNASMLLVIWENREWTTWFGRGERRGAKAGPAAAR